MADTCTRCKGPVGDRMPPEGRTMQIGMTRTSVTWRLRLRRFRWTWLPENPMDRVRESYSVLDLCDWCAGDVFLIAQGKPPRTRQGDEKAIRLAIKMVLVNLVVDLQEREAQDLAVACEANGWRMSDASDLYDAAIETALSLANGTLSPATYLTATDA